MRFKTSTLIWTFVWCLFMGITAGSIGLGAVFPVVNRITKPFLCSDGEMQLVTQDYHPSPIETVTTLTWYCVDGLTGARQEMSLVKMSLIAGTIYGLLFFAVVFAFIWILANRRGPSSTPLGLTELFARSGRTPSDPELSELADLDKRAAELRASSAQLREKLRDLPERAAAARGRRDGQTVDERLEKLKSLRDAGLITEQDYARKKTEILNDL